jgi:hypothetical protein
MCRSYTNKCGIFAVTVTLITTTTTVMYVNTEACFFFNKQISKERWGGGCVESDEECEP